MWRKQGKNYYSQFSHDLYRIIIYRHIFKSEIIGKVVICEIIKKLITNWGCGNNLEGWDGDGGWREVQEGGAIVYIWLIHGDIWQKPIQYCKAIVLQLKVNKLMTPQKNLMAFLFTSNKRKNIPKWEMYLKHV